MPASNELNFTMQAQLQDNWCWAANAASISLFYDTASTWTQCGVACITLNRADCCLPTNPNPCNEAWYLEQALTTTGNFSAPLIYNPLAQNDIIKQIDQGLVIGVRIGWSGGGGHFVSIYGYDNTPSGFFVHVGDPIYGNSTINLNIFITNYQGSGSWTHSYLTKKNAATMLQFTSIHKDIIKQANLLRESLANEKTVVHEAAKAEAPETPHEIYTITLASLKEGAPVIRKGGFRVIDPADTSERQMYDFSENGPQATVQQVIHSNTFSQKYQGVLDHILESQRSNKRKYTLRVIRQPELKIEAFWLHDERDSDADLYEAVLTSSILEKGKVYNEHEFFELLEVAAKNRRTYSDDLLGG